MKLRSKEELNEYIQEMVSEAFNQAGKRSAFSFYRKSKNHPDHKKASKDQKQGLTPFANDPLPDPTRAAQDTFNAHLIRALVLVDRIPPSQTQVQDPKTKQWSPASDVKHHQLMNLSAQKILTGQNISKKDVMLLARYLLAANVLPKSSLAGIARGLVDIFNQKRK